MTSSVDRNRKFSEGIFSTLAIIKALSLFSASIFFKICRFRNSVNVLLSFHSSRSDARVKFDSGVIFLDQSQ